MGQLVRGLSALLWWLFITPGRAVAWFQYMFPDRGQVWASARRKDSTAIHVVFSVLIYGGLGLFLGAERNNSKLHEPAAASMTAAPRITSSPASVSAPVPSGAAALPAPQPQQLVAPAASAPPQQLFAAPVDPAPPQTIVSPNVVTPPPLAIATATLARPPGLEGAISFALENGRSGAPIPWRDVGSGQSGAIIPEVAVFDQAGIPCRAYTFTNSANGAAEGGGFACRSPTGWKERSPR